jgi:hypothetical protein
LLANTLKQGHPSGMINEYEPVVRLQDWEIERLIAERKKVTPQMLQRLSQMRPYGENQLTHDCEIVGDEGSTFKIILRQNLNIPLDFSVILGYQLPDTRRIFRLRRYDSKAEHRNIIERQRFTSYHIHKATARYQARGFDEEGYAEPSDLFTDLHEALQCLFAECGCDLPPDAQIALFVGVRP